MYQGACAPTRSSRALSQTQVSPCPVCSEPEYFGLDNAGLQERGWYGKQFDPPIDVRGKHALTVDIKTMATGTQTAIAVQVDDDWTWCATPTPDWGQAEPGESLQVTLEFQTMTTNDDSTRCRDVLSSSAPTTLNAVWVWLDGKGSFRLDNVRIE